MALTREQKKDIVQKLGDAVAKAKTVVFVNFHGLGVSGANELRRSLREQDVVYTVAKKTLLRRVLAGAEVSGSTPSLEGEIAIAYLSASGDGQAGGDDPIAPAGGIAAFIKKHRDSLAIVGGIFEGRFVEKAEMEAIAAIPPLTTLRGMFVNVINSPIAGLAVALGAIAEKREA